MSRKRAKNDLQGFFGNESLGRHFYHGAIGVCATLVVSGVLLTGGALADFRQSAASDKPTDTRGLPAEVQAIQADSQAIRHDLVDPLVIALGGLVSVMNAIAGLTIYNGMRAKFGQSPAAHENGGVGASTTMVP